MSEIDTKRVRSCVETLEVAREDLRKARLALGRCNLSGHQQEIVVRVGETVINVASPGGSRDGYRSVVNRGCDMILLGVKKLAADHVDRCKQRVKEAELALREAAHKPQNARSGGQENSE